MIVVVIVVVVVAVESTEYELSRWSSTPSASAEGYGREF
jgi:hypothetical protein